MSRYRSDARVRKWRNGKYCGRLVRIHNLLPDIGVDLAGRRRRAQGDDFADAGGLVGPQWLMISSGAPTRGDDALISAGVTKRRIWIGAIAGRHMNPDDGRRPLG